MTLDPTGRAAADPGEAIGNARAWFEQHSGWAPPDADTIADWMADNVSRSPDGCLVEPEGWCAHGLASWWLILTAEQDADLLLLIPAPGRLPPGNPAYARVLGAHRSAMARDDPGYTDPTTGLFVLTARFLRDRGYCCEQGCRHCPYTAR